MKGINFLLMILFVGCAHEKKEDPISGPMLKRNESFRQCYYESESYLGRNAEPPERIMVKFTVTKEGKVQDEEIVKSTFKDASLHACIMDQIRQVKFGKLETQTEVYQPINFVPVQP